MQSAKFSRLLEPVTIGSVELKNRMVMAPMVCNAANPDGTVSDRVVDFYRKRADGLGLLVVEATSIAPGGESPKFQLEIFDDRFINGLRKLSEVIRTSGAKAIIQINHAGAKRIPRDPNEVLISASNVSITPGAIPRSMEISEVRNMVRAFGDAASRAVQAGFDGVEVHGAHFYLVNQFLSPYTNHRTDLYGGDFTGRIRFFKEVIQEIREKIGSKYIISCRINGVEGIENGSPPEEIIQIAKILEASGADLIHVSGVIRSVEFLHEGKPFKRLGGFLLKDDPLGTYVPAAAEIKKAVGIPVTVAGKIFDPVLAEQILEDEKVDLIAFGRQLIVNPEFAKMIIEGRTSDIRECNECFTCFKTSRKGRAIECSVNTELWA